METKSLFLAVVCVVILFSLTQLVWFWGTPTLNNNNNNNNKNLHSVNNRKPNRDALPASSLNIHDQQQDNFPPTNYNQYPAFLNHTQNDNSHKNKPCGVPNDYIVADVQAPPFVHYYLDHWLPSGKNEPIARDINKRRVIFVISPGHCGTKYLQLLLDSSLDVIALHEPFPPMLDKYLQLTNDYPLSASFQTRWDKKHSSLTAYIESHLDRDTVYAETSNMFIKTFWDVVMADANWEKDIIVLRRFFPDVVKSHTSTGHGNDHSVDRVWTGFLNTSTSINAAHSPPIPYTGLNFFDTVIINVPIQHTNIFAQVIRYLVDIEARAQRFIAQFADDPNTHITEVYLEEIISNEGKVKSLFERLNISLSPQTQGEIGKQANKKPNNSCFRTISEYEAKMHLFAYLLSVPVETLPYLPGMEHRFHADLRPFKVIAITTTENDADYIEDWINHLVDVAHVDNIILLDRGSTDKTVEIASTYTSFVSIKEAPSQSTYGEQYNTLLELALHEEATHVVTLGVRHRISPLWGHLRLFRQFALSLAPGESFSIPLSDGNIRFGENIIVSYGVQERGILTIPVDHNTPKWQRWAQAHYYRLDAAWPWYSIQSIE